MKNKKVKKYNWHFWIPSYKIQVVVEDACYKKAENHVNSIFLSYWNKPKIKFQFGQKII